MSKLYQVVGLYDASNGADRILDAKPWVCTFATEAEANEACKIANDFYFEKCKIPCEFEVREIDTDNLYTLDSLKATLDDEYTECWDPNS